MSTLKNDAVTGNAPADEAKPANEPAVKPVSEPVAKPVELRVAPVAVPTPTVAPPPASAPPVAAPAQAAPQPVVLKPKKKRLLRFVLLVLLPLIAATGFLYGWLNGGRWVTTDNAYVGAQKVLITPEVSGRITSIAVIEGQEVSPGDVLLSVDDQPARIALAEAQAKLAGARGEHDNLVALITGLNQQIDLAKQTMVLRKTDLERKRALSVSHAVTQSDVDTAQIASSTSEQALDQLVQSRTTALNQLLGDPQLPLERYPAYAAASAEVDKAERNLAETTIRAPLKGVATQVTGIQMGRYVNAGDALFAIIGSDKVWVDANPKETDLTHVLQGQAVSVHVDAFPGKTFPAHVAAISPGTGSQFSILPAQNATGNWVKVIQRVPIRIVFDDGIDTTGLRSGMSADVAIDTKYKRSISELVGPELGRIIEPYVIQGEGYITRYLPESLKPLP